MKTLIHRLQLICSIIFKTFVSQEFCPENAIDVCEIPFTKALLCIKNFHPLIVYRGKEWEENRNTFMINRHGMTWEEVNDSKNAHLFVASCDYYHA